MYLPVRVPIGAMSGILAYGVPAQPGALHAGLAVACTAVRTPRVAVSRVLMAAFMRAFERWSGCATLRPRSEATPIESAADLSSMRSMAGPLALCVEQCRCRHRRRLQLARRGGQRLTQPAVRRVVL